MARVHYNTCSLQHNLFPEDPVAHSSKLSDMNAIYTFHELCRLL